MADSPPPLVPLPFDEAIAWSIARDVVLPDEYYGVLQGQARSMAFSVSGIAQLDVLTAVKDSLTKVLQQGDSFGKWKKGVLSGEIPLQGLPAHRIENIFRTNIQSNYARGRCEQQRANFDSQPWLMYDAVNDARTRPAHSAMDGFVARYDDPVWNTWRTPNGYQCRCRLIALTERQAKQYILADQNRMQQPGMNDTRTKALIEGPDEGWDYDICREPMAGIESAVASRSGNVLGVDVPKPVNPSVIPFETITKTSASFKSTVGKALADLPENVKNALVNGGYKVKTGDFLTDVHPELKGVTPRGWPEGVTWDDAEGLYHGGMKQVSISERRRDQSSLVISERIREVVMHECGHAFDSCGMFSQTLAFTKAWEEDIVFINDLGLNKFNQLSYYLQGGDAGKSETFAQSLPYIVGGDAVKNSFQFPFPNCIALVKELMGIE